MLYKDMADLGAAGDKVDQLMVIGERLADGKWKNILDVPYLPKLEGTQRVFTALLLENEARYLQTNRPQVSMAGGGVLTEATKLLNVGSFDKFAFPLIRAIYPNLVANELVSVA